MRGKSSPRPRHGRRVPVLVVIAAIFAMSALVRLADGSGTAIAQGLGALAPAQAVVAQGPVEPAVCAPAPELADILESLTRREARVTALEAELADRERTVEVATAELQAGLAALELAELRLSRTIATASQAAEADLAKLTSVYENMKPADAAVLFGQMQPVFAAGFLGRMRADAAAAILAGLPPEQAYSISVVLAGRNANTPTE
jgi:flagellar motility protein MotE (MotC chaperone)